jgi:hypothetical protein
MTCKGCHSEKRSVYNGEVAIHFSGREGLEKPIVWNFPKLLVCLHCGFTEFTVPKRELQVLEQGTPVEGAVVFWPRSDANPEPGKNRRKSVSEEAN